MDTSEHVHVHMYACQIGDKRNDRKRTTIPSGSTLPGHHVTIAEIELQWTVNDLISRICQSAGHRFRSRFMLLQLSNSTFHIALDIEKKNHPVISTNTTINRKETNHFIHKKEIDICNIPKRSFPISIFGNAAVRFSIYFIYRLYFSNTLIS